MASIDEKRYYWLKLDKDFFKRHDIRIVEAMKNGKDYILFYLKLLCESTSHEGYLRFSPTIPYSEEMLSTVTDTNIDTVRAAVKIFTTLGMMTRLDDGTLYLEQVEKMIGSETGAALRKRQERARVKEIGTNGDTQGQCSQELEIDKELELEKDIEKDNKQKQIETNRSDSQSRRPTPSLGYGLAKVLSNAGYIDESEIVIDQYDELINSWLADYGKTVKDLRVKIGYFLRCAKQREFSAEDNKYCYFKTAMESSFSKEDNQEAFSKMMEELGMPSDDGGSGVEDDD